MRMYLPEKVINHRGRYAEVNITFKGRYKIEFNNWFVI